MLNTPILFLIFNRPDLTEQVFATIKQAQPKQLFVAADGPRHHKEGEAFLCQQTRAIVLNNIDWDCEVVTLLRDENLGCKIAVSQAITWFFKQVEKGIILEDDCLPNSSFFRFCDDLLNRYAENDTIMHIAGQSFYTTRDSNSSYYFTRYNLIWGWATWARAWAKYDIQMPSWPRNKEDNFLKNKIINKRERRFWYDVFDGVYKNEFDTWDYQWTYCIWNNNGLSICPNVNLISNIGFRSDATHTMGYDSKKSELKTYDINEIIYQINEEGPITNKKADNYIGKEFYTHAKKSLIVIFKNAAKNIIKYNKI